MPARRKAVGVAAMVRQRGRPSGAEAGLLRTRILEAAASEFSSFGFKGARIERVAQEAGCNRALVYFYFKDKAGLFQAVLDEAAEYRAGQMAAQPRTLSEGMIYWFRRNMAEPRRIRLIMQEALAEDPQTPIPRRRIDYLGRQLEVVKAFQEAGLLRSDIDARELLTIILALTSFPASFPRVAAVSLDAAHEAELTEIWSQCLASVARLLEPPSPDAAGDGPSSSRTDGAPSKPVGRRRRG
jgi:AcrR family transcriptional regulator